MIPTAAIRVGVFMYLYFLIAIGSAFGGFTTFSSFSLQTLARAYVGNDDFSTQLNHYEHSQRITATADLYRRV
jgi:hypothetical protein